MWFTRSARERVVSINLILSRTHENRLPVIRIQSSFGSAHMQNTRSPPMYSLRLQKCVRKTQSFGIDRNKNNNKSTIFPCNSTLTLQRNCTLRAELNLYEEMFAFSNKKILSFVNKRRTRGKGPFFNWENGQETTLDSFVFYVFSLQILFVYFH